MDKAMRSVGSSAASTDNGAPTPKQKDVSVLLVDDGIGSSEHPERTRCGLSTFAVCQGAAVAGWPHLLAWRTVVEAASAEKG